MMLTDRDTAILQTLAGCVPMLTVPAVAELFWPTSANHGLARKRLAALRAAGWIERHIVNASPPPPTEVPLFVWKPSAAPPDPLRLAATLRNRFAPPARPIEIIVPTARTACLFGSTARGIPSFDRRRHLLRLAEVYVCHRKGLSQATGHWIGREARTKAGCRQKDPDALLLDGNGNVLWAIQVAGQWGEGEIERFHEYCAQARFPYELW